MTLDPVRPQLQLALGSVATLGEELPTTGGRRVYAAVAPVGGRRLFVTLNPAPPEGPAAAVLKAKLDRFADLRHATIILPLASGEVDGRSWVVEADDGLATAAQRIRERGPLPVREAVRVVRDIARALTAMHRRGLTHGALVLDVVLLAPEGTLLTGLAFQTGGFEGDDLDALAKLSRTLFYGERQHDHAPLRRLPPEITALLDLMGSDDPSRRPQRAEAVLGVLDTFPVAQSSTLGEMLDSAGRGARLGGRQAALRWLAVGGLLLLLALWLASRR